MTRPTMVGMPARISHTFGEDARDSGERTRPRVRAAAPSLPRTSCIAGEDCFGEGAETSTRGRVRSRNTPPRSFSEV